MRVDRRAEPRSEQRARRADDRAARVVAARRVAQPAEQRQRVRTRLAPARAQRLEAVRRLLPAQRLQVGVLDQRRRPARRRRRADAAAGAWQRPSESSKWHGSVGRRRPRPIAVGRQPLRTLYPSTSPRRWSRPFLSRAERCSEFCNVTARALSPSGAPAPALASAARTPPRRCPNPDPLPAAPTTLGSFKRRTHARVAPLAQKYHGAQQDILSSSLDDGGVCRERYLASYTDEGGDTILAMCTNTGWEPMAKSMWKECSSTDECGTGAFCGVECWSPPAPDTRMSASRATSAEMMMM